MGKLFSPDALFASLVRALGVSPAEIQGAINFLVTELQVMKAEREGFKLGASQVVARFDQRLDVIEHKLNFLLSAYADERTEHVRQNGQAILPD